MLTFVLLYIIIITSLGVITPTYVNIYMYIFLHMYSVYQNIYLVDFVESDALIQERNELSSYHQDVKWHDESSFLSFRGTHHVLLIHLGLYPPCVSSQVSTPKRGIFLKWLFGKDSHTPLQKRHTQVCLFCVDYVDFWFSL